MTEIISTKTAPAAIGPYNQAVKVGNVVFCSGQIGLVPETGELAQGLEAQHAVPVAQRRDPIARHMPHAAFPE